MRDFGAVLFHSFHRLYARTTGARMLRIACACSELRAHAQKCTRMLRTSTLQRLKSLPLVCTSSSRVWGLGLGWDFV